jgi:hypothetical protein
LFEIIDLKIISNSIFVIEMNRIKDKIAIIGFGASGFGTYLGLKEKGFKNIYIYDQLPYKKELQFNHWSQKNLKKNYKHLKKKLGYINTANSKTYFGKSLKTIDAINSKIYDNKIGGGLLNYWGGVLQKFDKQVLNSCLQIDNLDEYYLKISKNIPISQITNPKSDKNTYSNQKDIKSHAYIEEIDKSISEYSSEIFKKDTIVAISENKNNEKCNCFIGCLKHKFFNTNNYNYNNDVIFINEEVKKINFDKNLIISNSNTQAFDKIFLNTGPYNDQKILIESLEIAKKSIRVKDSFSFTFPIYYKGKLNNSRLNFGLTNYIFNIIDNNITLGHAQVYPPIDHINRAIFPNFLWNKFNFLKNISINRLLWVRCYLNDEYSEIKEFHGNEQIQNIKNDGIKKIQNLVFKIIKKNIKSANFLPINLFINSKTSSHYAGDKKYIEKNILNQTENHYKKKIIFNDSLLWENLPSESPTFTIMANAFRNTDLYL